jgi:hypothetical protein
VRAGLVGAVVGLAGGVAVLWSCTVNRKSDSLSCASSATCEAGRVCMEGYCVVGTFQDARIDAPADAAICPTECQGNCNFQTKTCTINGAGGGAISCPATWNCVINCPVDGACGDINCTQSQSCKLACGAPGACRNVNCDSGNCSITCDGGGTVKACNNINCQGRCDVLCMGNDSCAGVTLNGGGSATCTGAAACGNVICGGLNACSVGCSGGSGSAVCGTITTGGGPANVTCTGNNACGDIISGPGALGAMCLTGSAACGNITCGASCRCDVTCNPTTNCGTNICPVGGGTTCVDANGLCSSAIKPPCRKC